MFGAALPIRGAAAESDVSLRSAGDSVASTGGVPSSVDVEHEVIACLNHRCREDQSRGNNVGVGITPVEAFDTIGVMIDSYLVDARP